MAGTLNQGQLVVVRFMDGRVLKGTTRDFAPNRPKFHMFPSGDESDQPLNIPVGALKAVFFVKSFEGNKDHIAANSFGGAKGQGRKIMVTFKDGEVLAGFTMGYSVDKQGFFVIPADSDCNNARVFVVNGSVNKVEWVTDVSSTVTVGASRPVGRA